MFKRVALLCSTSLVCLGTVAGAHAADLLKNHTFDESWAPWTMYTASSDLATGEIVSSKFVMHVNAPGENRWDIQFRQQGLTLEQNHSYTVKFTISATKATQVYAKIGQAGPPYNEYWNNDWTPFSLNANEPLTVERTFTMTAATDGGVEVGFHLGNGVTGEVPFDVTFDDIYLDDPEFVPPAGELLGNNTFNAGSAQPWSLYTATPELAAGELLENQYVLHVQNPGENRWDIQFRHQSLTLEEGHTYTVKFKIRASKATQVYVKVGQAGAPYNEYWNNSWTPFSLAPNEDLVVNQSFTMTQPTDGGCELAFHLGNGVTGEVPFDVFFDDLYLSDPEFNSDPEVVLPKPDIRINQTGYLPFGKKEATILSDAVEPLVWTLKNGEGIEVATGSTSVFGYDSSSGDIVHTANFSACTTSGDGFVLSVEKNGEPVVSHPFSIAKNMYSQLKYQALSYFYHNRSGMAIEMPFAGSEEYARAAGHPTDTMRTWPGTNQEDYVLDVSKGWYDAGDHGKYVPNGGISVWTLMNQYERTLYTFGGNKKAFGDGKLLIPENSNKVPDILDEARWEMEFLLAMQVPEGKQYAGMVHHKGHDAEWTGIPTAPANDPMVRYLAPVSTAATLNLAAVAAQSSRLWMKYDKAFAKKCLKAARAAWNAAKENPAIMAPNITSGGGLYEDSKLGDEFYWAACELFITTGCHEFRMYLKQSEYFLTTGIEYLAGWQNDPWMGVVSWPHVQGLGTISLAVVPSELHPKNVCKARGTIIAAADTIASMIKNEGYGVPNRLYSGYIWGSNSIVVNNCIISALAFDFTWKKKYLNDVISGMDYLMGRNAMDQSYVSGYGERPLKNPHHRFWAHQANSSYPMVPAGVLSGGPNSSVQDPYAQAAGLAGMPAQKCFVDHIESWSTNEITINWNAPLAWVAAFLDEKFNW